MFWRYITQVLNYPVTFPTETVFGVALAIVIVSLIYFFFKFNRDIFKTVDIVWVMDGAVAAFIVVFTILVRNATATVVLVSLFCVAIFLELMYFRKRGTGAVVLRRDAKVAVFPFLLESNVEEDWEVGYGLADIISRTITAYDLGVIDPIRAANGYLNRGVATEAQALEWAEGLEVDYVVFGRARRVGTNLNIRYKVVNVFERRDWPRTRVLMPSDRVFETARKVIADLAGVFQLTVKNEAARGYYEEPASSTAAWALYCEGRRLQIAGGPRELDKARALFADAVAKDENFTLAAVALVEVVLQLARRHVYEEDSFQSLLEDAYRLALRSVRQRPEIHETQNVMGEVFVYLSGGRDADLFRRAQTRFLEAVRLNPNSARSWYNLALISRYSVPDEDVGYADFLTKAISADPSYITARLALGRYLGERNDSEGARRQFRLALTYNQRNLAALNELGYFYLKRDDAEHAQEILERAKEVDGSNAATRFYLGLAYLQQRKYQLAEEELWAAVAFKPGELRYFKGLARALEEGRKYAEAMSVLEEAFKKTGDAAEMQKIQNHIAWLTEKLRAEAAAASPSPPAPAGPSSFPPPPPAGPPSGPPTEPPV